MRALLILLLLSGCATGTDEPSGGSDNLPSAGITGITLPPDPQALTIDDVRIGRPWGLIDAPDAMRVWFTAAAADDTSTIQVVGGSLQDGVWSVQPAAEVALAPTHPWEGGSVRHPSVIKRLDGSLLMAYAGGPGEIGLATSEDGSTWAGRTSPAYAVPGSDLSYPSLIDEPGRLLLFYVIDGAVYLAIQAAGEENFTLQPDPTLSPIEDVTLTSASVITTTTALGRTLYRCHFTDDTGIGVAAGFDAEALERSDLNPVLENAGLRPREPMQAGAIILVALNTQQNKPAEGTSLGIATFGP